MVVALGVVIALATLLFGVLVILNTGEWMHGESDERMESNRERQGPDGDSYP